MRLLHTIIVELFPLVQPTMETRTLCPGDSTFVLGVWVSAAGSLVETLSGVNGCDSMHTISVVVLPPVQNTFELQTICFGDSIQVFGAWVTQGGMYNKIYTIGLGCDSVHTIEVLVLPDILPTNEVRTLCPGDSTQVFGNWVNQQGVFSQTLSGATGCDSIYTIEVLVLPDILPTNEVRTLCAGDSTLVFGNWVNQQGVFSQTLSGANGCDSVHTIEVLVLPDILPTNEVRTLCAGDSTLAFGNWVNQQGVFSQTLSGANGCDSVHTIEVLVLPDILPTNEVRTLCAGDSTLVFGNWVNQQGMFAQTMNSANGCDSVHTIEVLVLPDILPTNEVRTLCAGDSTLVFGNWVNQQGMYQQMLISENGCDSLHTIQIDLSAPPVFHLPADTLIIAGTEAILHPEGLGSGMFFYEWQPADFLDCAECAEPATRPLQNIIYTLTVNDDLGCSWSDSIEVTLLKASRVFVPNIFRPGGVHGVFMIYAQEGTVQTIRNLEVFDRWGSMVFSNQNFSAGDESAGWDGRYRGHVEVPGVFVWWAELEYYDGTTEKIFGEVTLVR
ncbi:MAG: gliding motility-associated C-terminal domain-containing protein [Lewinellaceae bacterium]|nr:gliding motility-associated C-terminal domain-containing protein [Lewinellaceae bacterium]